MAEKAFKEIQSCGLEPNVVTYTTYWELLQGK